MINRLFSCFFLFASTLCFSGCATMLSPLGFMMDMPDTPVILQPISFTENLEVESHQRRKYHVFVDKSVLKNFKFMNMKYTFDKVPKSYLDSITSLLEANIAEDVNGEVIADSRGLKDKIKSGFSDVYIKLSISNFDLNLSVPIVEVANSIYNYKISASVYDKSGVSLFSKDYSKEHREYALTFHGNSEEAFGRAIQQSLNETTTEIFKDILSNVNVNKYFLSLGDTGITSGELTDIIADIDPNIALTSAKMGRVTLSFELPLEPKSPELYYRKEPYGVGAVRSYLVVVDKNPKLSWTFFPFNLYARTDFNSNKLSYVFRYEPIEVDVELKKGRHNIEVFEYEIWNEDEYVPYPSLWMVGRDESLVRKVEELRKDPNMDGLKKKISIFSRDVQVNDGFHRKFKVKGGGASSNYVFSPEKDKYRSYSWLRKAAYNRDLLNVALENNFKRIAPDNKRAYINKLYVNKEIGSVNIEPLEIKANIPGINQDKNQDLRDRIKKSRERLEKEYFLALRHVPGVTSVAYDSKVNADASFHTEMELFIPTQASKFIPFARPMSPHIKVINTLVENKTGKVIMRYVGWQTKGMRGYGSFKGIKYERDFHNFGLDLKDVASSFGA